MTTRRLAAILAADVVGFSAMMERDEEGTLRLVKALQSEVIEPKVKERGGRLVKTTGDGFLCRISAAPWRRCDVRSRSRTQRAGMGSRTLLSNRYIASTRHLTLGSAKEKGGRRRPVEFDLRRVRLPVVKQSGALKS